MYKKLITISLFLTCANVYAQNIVSGLTANIKEQWNKSLESDLYVPLHTWHNRHFYSADKIAEFNENPYGIGYGKSYLDEKQNWHGFYGMVFADSHNKPEPIAGYGYTKNLYKDGYFVGAGYTVFLTARSDINNYLPIPGILPLVSVGYKRFTLTGTYLPGGKGNGNIAFIWGKYNFK